MILGHPDYRCRYNEILIELLDGPLAPASLNAYLDQLEPVLTPTLSVDPDNQLTGTVAEHFDELQQWMIDRAANVQSQVYAEYPDLNPTVGPPVVGDMNGDRVVDADDAAALMIALTQPLAYIAAYPGVDASTIGDVDGSCTFDLGDLSGFSSLLGPASAESVPEPASAVLLLIAAAMLCGRARRRV